MMYDPTSTKIFNLPLNFVKFDTKGFTIFLKCVKWMW